MSVERQRLAALLKGHGIEIGALHRPLAVSSRAHVTYVDRLPVHELRNQYKELAALELAPVDMIGSAEDLTTFADNTLDFVIANHLIEHLEDPIRALKEFERVLRPRGLVFMCVPDARVTFDRLRTLTPNDHIIGEHRGGPDVIASNKHDHYMDWVVNVENSGVLPDEGRSVSANSEADRVRELIDMNYSIHFHCWNASTFLQFFEMVRREERLELQIIEAVDTAMMGVADELILLVAKQPNLSQRVRAKHRPDQGSIRLLKEYTKGSVVGPSLLRVYRLFKR